MAWYAGTSLRSRGTESPAPRRDGPDLAFGARSRAATLALAGVLGFATLVARLAAALALTGVLTFAAMHSRAGVVSELSGVEGRVIGTGLGRLKADSSPRRADRPWPHWQAALLRYSEFSYVFFLFLGCCPAAGGGQAFDPPSREGKSAGKVLAFVLRSGPPTRRRPWESQFRSRRRC